MPIPFYNRQSLGRRLTKIEGDTFLAALATGSFQKHIATAANGDSTIVLKAPYGGNIVEVASQCDSGTCTATVKIDGVALAGSANAVSTTLQSQTQAAANAFVAGSKIVVTISANATALNVALSLKFIRTID